MTWLRWISTAFKIIGALGPMIKGLVEAMEVPGNGGLKKEKVMEGITETVDQLIEVSDITLPPFIKAFILWCASLLVDKIVAVKNETGEFEHTTEV